MMVTHARVKYLDDDFIAIISIEKILEFKRKRPEHKDDFYKTKVYRAEYIDDKNPEIIISKIQIADLASKYIN